MEMRTPLRAALSLRRRLSGVPIASIGFLLGVLIVAVVGPFLVSHDAVYRVNLTNALVPPFTDSAHVLGTDSNGRDVLARLVVGARSTMIVATVALVAGAVLGTMLGLVAGFSGGRVDGILMRITDAVLPFPTILLAIFAAVVLGPGFGVVVGVIAFVLWARFARVVRGDVRAVRNQDYVIASEALGASPLRLMLINILPNVIATILVVATLELGWVVLIEASLSFLGAGVPPPTPSWGGMIASGREYLTRAWWLTTIPGVAIVLVVISFNVLGDWLRDVFDPNQDHRANS